MKFLQRKTLGGKFERSRFHGGRSRFVEIQPKVADCRISGLRIVFLRVGELERLSVFADKDGRFTAERTFQHEQQVLRLSAYSHHMHFAYMIQGVQSAADVEHRGEFQHHEAGLFEQQLLKHAHVGLTVGNEHRFASGCVASGGVEEEKVNGLHGAQKVRAVGADHFGLGQTQQRKIVARQSTERLLPFHIGGVREAACHEAEVHAKASREVGHAGRPFRAVHEVLHHGGLVACCRFARTLLECQAVGVAQAVDGSPRRHFVAHSLPAFHLLQRVGHVDVLAAGEFQGKFADGNVAEVIYGIGHGRGMCKCANVRMWNALGERWGRALLSSLFWGIGIVY